MNKSNTIFKSFSVLTGITLLEKIVAFAFEAIIAAKLGTSIITDAYFSASELYTLIDAALLSSLTVVALNRFSFYANQNGEEKAFASLSDLLSLYLPLVFLISALLFGFAGPLSYIVAPGYDERARAVLVRCIRVMAVVPNVACVTAVALAILRQKRRFGITGLKSLFISVAGICSIILFGSRDIRNADILSVAYVCSVILYCGLTLWIVRRYGRLTLHKPVLNEEIRGTFKMIAPLMVSYGIASVVLMIDKIISSMLGEGYVSALTYAHCLYRVVATVFVQNLATIVLTDFNELMAQKRYEEITKKIQSVVSIMTEILLPITIVTVICSRDIVKIVFERGSFLPTTTVIVAATLLAYGLNFIPAMIQGVYNQVLYAAGDTKSPMWIAVLTIIVNFAVSWPLVFVVGLPGVAIGTVVSTVAAVAISLFAVRKYLHGNMGCYSLKFICKAAIAAIPCVGAVWTVKMFHLPALVTFVLAAFAGFAIFFGIMLVLKETYLLGILSSVKEKLAKK